MIAAYYRLAKPGIIYGNLLSTVAGFMLASHAHIRPMLFLATVFGISFVMGSACVFNNYLDRSIDEKMERTRNRASVTGLIPLKFGITYGFILGLIGFALLFFYTNVLTTWIAFVGVIIYVIIYGIFKRLSSFGTIVGSLAGAVPPLVGYCAVSNKVDTGAIIIFFILILWQMPHFYAIAIFRKKEYEQAGIPVLPLTAGIRTTQFAMLGFILAFAIACVSLTFYHHAGIIYAVAVSVVSLWWFSQGLRGFNTSDEIKWSRKMFFNSLIVLLVVCVCVSVGVLLP